MKNKICENIILKTGLCAFFIMLAICVIFNITPFGDNTFLTGDLNGQYISYFAQVRNAIIDGEGLLYSNYKTIGGPMVGIIAYYTASPFVLLYVIVNPLFYPLLTTFVIFAKVILLCVCMAFFLAKKLQSKSNIIILFSLCYGFCGYVFVYMQNFMWHDVLILLPLLCYGVDILIKKQSPFLYAFLLFLAVFVNFYIAYMVCLFLVAYFLYSLFILPNLNKKQAFFHCVRFGFASLLGGLSSAVLLLPALNNISQSKEIGAQFALQFSGQFSPLEFLTRLFPFAFYWPNLINDLPNVYAGIITVMLSVAFFFVKGISKRQKIAALVVLAFLFLSMYSTDLMLIFHGFTAPVWFTHRHAFLFVFWLLFLATTAFVKGEICKKTIAVISAVTLLLLIIRAITVQEVYTTNRLLFTIALCTGLIALLFFSLKYKKIAVLGLIVLTGAELFVNTYYAYTQFEQYTQSDYENFYNDNTHIVNEIYKHEQNDDFRIEKNYFRSLNDPFLINYYGLSHFGSTQDNNAYDFLSNLSAYEINDNLKWVDNGNVFTQSLLGVKYLLINEDYPIVQGFEKTNLQHNDIYVYENPYVFSLAFMLPYESSINASYGVPFENTQQFTEDIFNILKADSFKGELYDENGNVNLDVLAQLSENINSQSATLDFTRGGISAQINAKQDGVLYISVPYNEHFNISVNGQKTAGITVFETQLGVPVSQGENIIEVSYTMPQKNIGLFVSAISILALIAWYICKKRGYLTRTKS